MTGERLPDEILVDRDFLTLVGRLPVGQRDALVLRYLLGFSNPEIAEILDRSEAAVRQLQSRALKTLAHRVSVRRGPRSVPQRHPAGPRPRAASALVSAP